MKLLYEYRGPAAHPIIYAGMLLFGVVFITGSLENLAREQRAELYLWYALPLLLVLAWYVLMRPSAIRIYEEGIQPARPLLLRWNRPFIAWDDLAAVYPSFYDVTGAFVSPFASSDGKVTQMGLGLEWPDGRRETVRFTPTRFSMYQAASAGYQGALEAVRHAFGDRPLTPAAEQFTRAERERMLADASKPFLPFFAIVFLFASAAPILWLLTRFTPLPVGAALVLALVPPMAVSIRSYVQSQRRNRTLDRLSKAAEFERHEQGA